MRPDTSCMREGCPAALPALQEGETLVAGQVLHPEMQPARLQCFKWWQQRCTGRLEAASPATTSAAASQGQPALEPWQLLLEPTDGMAGLMEQLPGQHHLLRNLACYLGLTGITMEQLLQVCTPSVVLARPSAADTDVAAAAAELGNAPAAAQLELAARWVPADPPCEALVSITVPDSDPRVGLRDQQGACIRPATAAAAGQVLGPYRCYCMPAQVYEELLQTPPAWLVQQCGDQEMALEQWGLWLEGHSLDHFDVPTTDGTQAVAFSSWGWGNSAVLVNDPHVNPFDLQAYGTPAGLMKAADGAPVCGNVMVISVLYLGWPYAFMVATQDIAAGQELHYCYGKDYWEGQRRHTRTLQHLAQIAELRRVVQEQEAVIRQQAERIQQLEAQLDG